MQPEAQLAPVFSSSVMSQFISREPAFVLRTNSFFYTSCRGADCGETTYQTTLFNKQQLPAYSRVEMRGFGRNLDAHTVLEFMQF
jgi:hypothetical protein